MIAKKKNHLPFKSLPFPHQIIFSQHEVECPSPVAISLNCLPDFCHLSNIAGTFYFHSTSLSMPLLKCFFSGLATILLTSSFPFYLILEILPFPWIYIKSPWSLSWPWQAGVTYPSFEHLLWGLCTFSLGLILFYSYLPFCPFFLLDYSPLK